MEGQVNSVKYLQSITFTELTRDEQIQIKSKGRPTPHLCIQQKSKSRTNEYVRYFKETLYEKTDWLCGCNEKNALFCFPCLVFGGDHSWTKIGVTDLKHVREKAQKHEQSSKHIHNVIDLSLLGTVDIADQINPEYKLYIARHNKEVEKNRNALSKIINCIKFCGKFELPLRRQDGAIEYKKPGVLPGLVDFACTFDSSLDAHLCKGTVFKSTSTAMQNELLESMLKICKNKIREEIKNADYLAIMCDKVTDVNDETLMVIVLRYELQGKPVERYWGYFTLMNPTAEAFSSVLLKELQIMIGDSQHKLIAQAYDGAVPVSGVDEGVQVLVKRVHTNAHFIHCYAHPLSFILEQAASKNTNVRVFFNSLSGIPTFFSKSPQRMAALEFVTGRHIPRPSAARYFMNRTITAVLEIRNELIECCSILEALKNKDTGSGAARIKRILSDPEFEFWFEFFSRLMPHVDVMFPQLNIDAARTDAAVKTFTPVVENLRDECDTFVLPPEQKRRKLDTDELAAAREVCDVMLLECRARFSFTAHLEASKLLLVRKFPKYIKNFPCDALARAVSAYPMLDKDKLRNELAVLYLREDLCKSGKLTDLLEIMNNNNLQSTFSETVKLLKILITTPMTTAEDERCFSTLKRIKTFLRGAVANERLPALAMMSIENALITEMEDFNEQVINHYATAMNQVTDAPLLYSNHINSTNLQN